MESLHNRNELVDWLHLPKAPQALEVRFWGTDLEWYAYKRIGNRIPCLETAHMKFTAPVHAIVALEHFAEEAVMPAVDIGLGEAATIVG